MARAPPCGHGLSRSASLAALRFTGRGRQSPCRLDPGGVPMPVAVQLFQPAGWRLSLYPQAGEAGGCFQPSVHAPRVYVPGAPAADPDRALAEARRRARTKVRRYCAANRLNRLGTLTYRGGGCHDPVQLRADVAAFFKNLRLALGGGPLPYVWVPEWHKTDHGLHVHFAVGQYIRRSLIAQAWAHGFIHIKALTDLPVGSTSWHEARRAAGYLSKYVTKSFETDLAGMHRYEVAQGFQPAVERLSDTSRDRVLAQATRRMGAAPSRVWFSEDTEAWVGPPAMWFAWD